MSLVAILKFFGLLWMQGHWRTKEYVFTTYNTFLSIFSKKCYYISTLYVGRQAWWHQGERGYGNRIIDTTSLHDHKWWCQRISLHIWMYLQIEGKIRDRIFFCICLHYLRNKNGMLCVQFRFLVPIMTIVAYQQFCCYPIGE